MTTENIVMPSLITITAPVKVMRNDSVKMVEIVVLIAGVVFTISEATEILETLINNGLDRPGYIDSRSDFIITIKGVNFSAIDAHALAVQLKEKLQK